jgi:hypothetical protein
MTSKVRVVFAVAMRHGHREREGAHRAPHCSNPGQIFRSRLRHGTSSIPIVSSPSVAGSGTDTPATVIASEPTLATLSGVSSGPAP